METAKHYEELLAPVYEWMVGDFALQTEAFGALLTEHGIVPSSDSKQAVDLGAGHGVQSVAMARAGYKVTAVDFNETLLASLKQHAEGLPVVTHLGDIKLFSQFPCEGPFGLVVCAGDTLTHLDTVGEIECLVTDIAKALAPKGTAVLTFRDYSEAPEGGLLVIPVKQDTTRKFTCRLNYSEANKVTVTDTVEELGPSGWVERHSSYKKVRVSPERVVEMLAGCGLKVTHPPPVRGMHVVVAQK
eukprot:TRINITY_DN3025_c7_g1_i1.p1 TRINITY_DN3025_c7_g1~~TRINITY_DN3025_c7_g1_i1.p1  ORF type:complete len:244 (+),score=63.31 TRINITY_DN3025_c7_g1_i1:59-790(+)